MQETRLIEETRNDSNQIGKSVSRVDGEQFVDGSASYIDDIDSPNQLYLGLTQSKYGHAIIEEIDTEPARQMEGVKAIITGEDVVQHTEPIGAESIPGNDNQYGLAVDRIRYHGEPVAAVAAVDPYLARDAADRITVKTTRLDVTVDPLRARESDSPNIHPELQDIEQVDGNISQRMHQEVGDVDRGFKHAETIVENTFRYPPINGAPLETHGCIAEYDNLDDELTIYLPTQVIHRSRKNLARIFGIPINKVRVIQPEIGGSFGNKIIIRPHEVCAVLLSKLTGHPVKAKLNRAEHLGTTTASLQYIVELSIGVDSAGDIVAWRESVIQDGGAYHPRGIRKPGLNTAPLPYKVPNIEISAEAVYTNRVPSGPVRGVAMRQLAFARESLIDELAAKLGRDPIEYRMDIGITQDECPYTASMGQKIGSSGLVDALQRARDNIDYEDLRKKSQTQENFGVGVAAAMHLTSCKYEGGTPDFGAVEIAIETDGSVTLRTEACEMGTGTRTSLAQIVADKIGVSLDRIKVIDGDTDRTPEGLGSYASRTLSITGSATNIAAERAESLLRKVGAHKLEANPDEIVLADDKVCVAKTDRRLDIADIVTAIRYDDGLPEEVEAGPFNISAHYETGEDSADGTKVTGLYSDATGNIAASYPVSVQVVACSIDEGTGSVTIEEQIVVDDAGKAVNPAIIEGQAIGGAAQALGSVLAEALRFDSSSGQLMNNNFTSYRIPTAMEVPDIKTDIVEIPSPNTSGGWKGIAEGSMISGPSATANAIADALDTRVTQLPMDPQHVVAMLRENQ